MYDITILTDHRYLKESYENPYDQNVIVEDNAVRTALEAKGLKVHRTNWDNPNFDWSTTKYVIFRTTWDYFERFPEFSKWLEEVSTKTNFINQKDLIYWNVDKHYLADINEKGIHIPSTVFVEQGDTRSLSEVVSTTTWDEIILKPVVSGAARHTYRFKPSESENYEEIFQTLIAEESMMIQEFQNNILTKGEVSLMVFGGKFSHAILKKGKPGDFRVQDDFGGSVHPYSASEQEIAFAENAAKACTPMPIYARVDMIWDNDNQPAIGEIELIEPELWFRMDDNAASMLAEAIIEHIN